MRLGIRCRISLPLVSFVMLVGFVFLPGNCIAQVGSRASSLSSQTVQVPRPPSTQKPGEVGQLLSFYGGQAYQPGGLASFRTTFITYS
jgi:hypothetical protein